MEIREMVDTKAAYGRKTGNYFEKLIAGVSQDNENVAQKCKPTKSGFWKDIILRWRESGLTKAEFCRQEGLRINTFNIWNTALSGMHMDAERVRTRRKSIEVSEVGRGRDSAPQQSIAAEVSDLNGNRRVVIYDGASSHTVNAIMNTFIEPGALNSSSSQQ